MDDIYQRIYTADVAEASGLRAVLPSEPAPAGGHVVVAEAARAPSGARLLRSVVIPPHKARSYELAEALFDNYDLLSSVPDDIAPHERAEADALLAHVVDAAPMRLAREYIAARGGRALSDAAWYARVAETWFRPFRVGASPTRSGFEHVFLGEHKAGAHRVGGLHWWYFYHRKMQALTYQGAVYDNLPEGVAVPEIATLSFQWRLPDGQSIVKPIGGFFVGPSVEGLMAMGMVRASVDAEGPNFAVIEGAEVELKLFRSPDRRSINTFYPVFKRLIAGIPRPVPAPVPAPDQAATPAPVPGPIPERPPPLAANGALAPALVRIVTALANPAGHDAGRENVTLINFGVAAASIKGWRVEGPNGSALVFGDVTIAPGAAQTIVVPARADLQLSNSGGTIRLLDHGARVVQELQYDSRDANKQGSVLLWDRESKLVGALA